MLAFAVSKRPGLLSKEATLLAGRLPRSGWADVAGVVVIGLACVSIDDGADPGYCCCSGGRGTSFELAGLTTGSVGHVWIANGGYC